MYELQQILERISDGIFAVDHHWRITYMNHSLETMLSVN
ncbi:MAG: PAS domain-containing protein, partial [Chitinophagaceae bacterium]